MKPHWRIRLPELAEKIRLREREKWADLSDREKLEYHLMKRYKLSYDQWIEMFEKQDYKCFLCESQVDAKLGNGPTRGVVDHCHTKNEVRKILCHNCNRALGLVKDNKKTLEKMVEYIN